MSPIDGATQYTGPGRPEDPAPPDPGVGARPTPPRRGFWRRHKAWLIPALAFVAGLIFGTLGRAEDPSSTRAAVVASASTVTTTVTATTTAPGTTVTAEPSTAAADYVPGPRDFKLTVKVKTRECFGSAGCNVTYRVELAKYGGQPIPDDARLEVTYTVTGPEDGAHVGTIIVTNAATESDDVVASTKSASTPLKVKVTAVERVS